MNLWSQRMLLGVLCSLQTALVIGQAATHSAVTPVPREGSWMERHRSFNERVQANQDQIDLVFIGDSITEGWERRGRLVWESYYAHRKALNLGIGGDRTQHVLWRLDHGNLEGIHPKVAVIMIGTNNSKDDRNTATEMVDGVRAVVAKLRSSIPKTKLLLLAIFPRGMEFNPQRGKILQVNQAISRLHDGKSVFYRDIGASFLGDDGVISPSIMPDSLHLSTAGYGVWANAIESFVSKHLGDAPIEIEPAAVAGDWTFEIEGPNGMSEARMNLRTDRAMLDGWIKMGPDRELAFESGGRFKDYLHFQIVRDRPQGGYMTYDFTGTVKAGRIRGEVTAKVDGEATTIAWEARRR